MNHIQKTILLSLTALTAAPAWAGTAWGPYLELTAFPSYRQSNREGTSDLAGGSLTSDLNAESGFSYDLRNTLGIKPAEWLLIGATYNYSNSPLKRSSATATAPTLDRSITHSEFGPTVGFFAGNLRFLGTYFLTGQMKVKEKAVNLDGSVASDQTITNRSASGFQLTLGYSFAVSSSFKIGPTLVYRKVSYSKQDRSNSVDTSSASNYTDQPFQSKSLTGEILPMISLILDF